MKQNPFMVMAMKGRVNWVGICAGLANQRQRFDSCLRTKQLFFRWWHHYLLNILFVVFYLKKTRTKWIFFVWKRDQNMGQIKLCGENFTQITFNTIPKWSAMTIITISIIQLKLKLQESSHHCCNVASCVSISCVETNSGLLNMLVSTEAGSSGGT